MPNWCENELTISGNSKELRRFEEFAKRYLDEDGKPIEPDKIDIPTRVIEKVTSDGEAEQLLWFGAFVPEPDYSKMESEDCMPSWWNWRIANWGTKWGAREAGIAQRTPKSIVYSMSTAWSPPLPVIKAMSKLFPTLRFTLKYWESGAGFRGKLVCKADVVLCNENDDYHGGRGG